ncbi:hypothetical protein L3Q82_010514 [Scortum barcoo]|uniref:Uncharacterized protein n=1 Tax=Scortum barcoo TaxID=214431 RepID=A0ACB8WD98_9TELE|nr:hypothetical protein L3Q82_010514 [Scortum barcoo]
MNSRPTRTVYVAWITRALPGPHPGARPGAGARRQAPGGRVFAHGTWLGSIGTWNVTSLGGKGALSSCGSSVRGAGPLHYSGVAQGERRRAWCGLAYSSPAQPPCVRSSPRGGSRTDLADPNACIVRVCWERLADEPSVREVFNSHLRKSFSQIPEGGLGTLSPSGPCSLPPLSTRQFESCGHKVSGACRGGNPLNPVVDTGSKEGMPVRLKKESLSDHVGLWDS